VSDWRKNFSPEYLAEMDRDQALLDHAMHVHAEFGPDPLGLTPEQREVSDMNEAVERMLVSDWAGGRTGLITVPLACGHCRRYGHIESECPYVINGEWSEA